MRLLISVITRLADIKLCFSHELGHFLHKCEAGVFLVHHTVPLSVRWIQTLVGSVDQLLVEVTYCCKGMINPNALLYGG